MKPTARPFVQPASVRHPRSDRAAHKLTDSYSLTHSLTHSRADSLSTQRYRCRCGGGVGVSSCWAVVGGEHLPPTAAGRNPPRPPTPSEPSALGGGGRGDLTAAGTNARAVIARPPPPTTWATAPLLPAALPPQTTPGSGTPQPLPSGVDTTAVNTRCSGRFWSASFSVSGAIASGAVPSIDNNTAPACGGHGNAAAWEPATTPAQTRYAHPSRTSSYSSNIIPSGSCISNTRGWDCDCGHRQRERGGRAKRTRTDQLPPRSSLLSSAGQAGGGCRAPIGHAGVSVPWARSASRTAVSAGPPRPCAQSGGAGSWSESGHHRAATADSGAAAAAAGTTGARTGLDPPSAAHRGGAGPLRQQQQQGSSTTAAQAQVAAQLAAAGAWWRRLAKRFMFLFHAPVNCLESFMKIRPDRLKIQLRLSIDARL
jgi:hypothetical protein